MSDELERFADHVSASLQKSRVGIDIIKGRSTVDCSTVVSPQLLVISI
jgi:hypothetical protein